MTSRKGFENKWCYMKYIGKYLSGEMYNNEMSFVLKVISPFVGITSRT
jgi:hypothetical protein